MIRTTGILFAGLFVFSLQNALYADVPGVSPTFTKAECHEEYDADKNKMVLERTDDGLWKVDFKIDDISLRYDGLKCLQNKSKPNHFYCHKEDGKTEIFLKSYIETKEGWNLLVKLPNRTPLATKSSDLIINLYAFKNNRVVDGEERVMKIEIREDGSYSFGSCKFSGENVDTATDPKPEGILSPEPATP